MLSTCSPARRSAAHGSPRRGGSPRSSPARFCSDGCSGVASVLKLWHLSHAPRWMILSGVGYVTLMLPPALTGFAFAWGAGRLAARGWGRASLALAGAGVTGLVAGLLVL